jgi:hypothetical protein
MPAMIAHAFIPRLYSDLCVKFLCACLLPYMCPRFFATRASYVFILPVNLSHQVF